MAESKPGNPAWVPGVSGNPSGRKKIPDDVKKIFTDASADVARALVKAAKNPRCRDQVKAAIHVMDRVYGKVPDKLQHSGDGGGPITLAALKDLSDEELVARATKVIEARAVDALEAEEVLPATLKITGATNG